MRESKGVKKNDGDTKDEHRRYLVDAHIWDNFSINKKSWY